MTSTDTSAAAARSIDRDALRRKYREERDKRLRPDGNAQYVQASGRFEFASEAGATGFDVTVLCAVASAAPNDAVARADQTTKRLRVMCRQLRMLCG